MKNQTASSRKGSRTMEPITKKSDIARFLRKLEGVSPTCWLAALIGLHWGLRASDILPLTVGDVIAGTGKRVQIVDHIRVKEKKTGKERPIYISDDVKDALAMQVKALRRKYGDGFDVPLFASRQRGKDGGLRPICWQTLQNAIRKAGKLAGLRLRLGTHSMRKTFAHQAWKAGVRVDLIQKAFGHSSLAVTYRYANIPDEEVEAIYKTIDFVNKTSLAEMRKRLS